MFVIFYTRCPKNAGIFDISKTKHFQKKYSIQSYKALSDALNK